MRATQPKRVSPGTDAFLVRAAVRVARVVVERRRGEGWSDERIGREVASTFARRFAADAGGGREYEVETLVAAFQRGVAAALAGDPDAPTPDGRPPAA